ncbi:RNA polymerase sigma factor [Pseudoflavitalea rhizosphaerae]|uniref:RNA polymerase sigma factor n=1 Tax=Pseudoflavitalea rhizosphaerae TaxID=1884793 RepID=UPI0013E0500E|nr:sigma-70 family RNA polymerase sigma factor [Pseudoflavitalea rhizosphaerae]
MLTAGPYNQKYLLDLIARSDQQAFTELFHFYRNRTYTHALALVQSSELAEEIVQEVFLQLWIKREQMPSIDNIEAYLNTMVKHRAFRALKNIARYNNILQGSDQSEWHFSQQLQELVQQKEFAAIIREAVAVLPPRQKLAWQLNREQQLPRVKVAEIMGLSPETVKVHLAHAMRSVKAYCQARIEFAIIFLLLLEK